MWSKFIISKSFNADRIVDDLTQTLPKVDPQKSIGFLSCDPDIVCSKLLFNLQQKIPFPVVGVTTMPFFGDEANAVFTVVSKDELNYNIEVSDALKPENAKEQMDSLYKKCTEGLGEKPKLLIALLPLIQDLRADIYLKHLFIQAGDIPVVGGMASADFSCAHKAGVFVSGELFQDRLVLIALGGDIKPVLSVGCNLTALSDNTPVITRSENNVIMTVDDMPFCDYLRKLGFDPEDMKNGVYGPITVLLYGEITENDGFPVALELIKTDPVNGYGIVSASVAEGNSLNIGFLSKKDIRKSVRTTFTDLLKQMAQNEKNGYDYSVMFGVMCLTRYFTLSGHENTDYVYIMENLPPDTALFCYYGSNEICPTQDKNGRLYNRTHGNSIAICAF